MVLEIIVALLALAVLWLFVQMRDLRDELERLRQPREPRSERRPAATTTQDRPAQGSDAPKAAAKPATAAPAPQVTTRAPSPLARASSWVQANWVLCIAGVSLALAAVFLVQYGIEAGLLGPFARVIGATLLGAAFLAVAEYLRQRPRAAGPHIPTMFAAAGIVALFVAAFAAHALYGLIGPGAGFLALASVALLGTFGGWVYGPYLSALGVVGGLSVPFLLDDPNAATGFIYIYPIVLAAMGMLIDSLRGWVWVSAVAVIGAFVSLALFFVAGTAPSVAPLAFAGLMVLPPFCLYLSPAPAPTDRFPWHGFITEHERYWAQSDLRIPLIILTVIGGCAALVGLAAQPVISLVVVLWGFAGLFVIYGLYLYRAAAIEAALWAISLAAPLAVLVTTEPLRQDPDAAHGVFDFPILMLIGATALAVLVLAWRVMRSHWPAISAIVTGLVPALMVYAIASQASLPDAWPFYVLGLAAVLTAATVLLVRAGVDRAHAAYLALGALGLMAYALFLLLSGGALTAALAVAIALAAYLDRRFDLRPVTLFVIGASALLGWRSFGLPGDILHASNATSLFVSVVFLAALGSAFGLLRGRRAYAAEVMLTGLVGGGVIIAAQGADRIIGLVGVNSDYIGFVAVAFVPLFVGSFGQLYLWQRAQRLRWVRLILACLLGLGLSIALAILLMLNPLVDQGGSLSFGQPRGIVIFNDVTLAYLGGAVMFILARSITPSGWRWPLIAVAAPLALIWAVTQIRMVFHSDVSLFQTPFSQPELYTYTVVLMVAAALCLYQAIARQSVLLRRVGLALVALTVAKVFLVDITALTGLLRVFAFLILGLVLAALAWLDGWIAKRGR